ncbi:TMAO reductase [Bradyrhizobium sp. LTSPM299]|nr:TMAO reductase [Bradyrhizobium sp. LTSPM299]
MIPIAVCISTFAGVASAAVAQEKPWWPISLNDATTAPAKISDYTPLAKASKVWKICVLFPHMKDSFWNAVDYGVVEEARREGVSVAIYEAGGYDQLPKQLSQFDDCIASGSDAIVLGAISEAGLKQKLSETAAAGKPVIAIANPVGDAPAAGKIYGEFTATGGLTGTELLTSLAGKPAQVVTFPGPQGSGWAEALNDGFLNKIKGTQIKVLDQKFGDTGVGVQLKLVEDALQTYPDLNVIWGTAPTAEAAIGAVVEAGRPGIAILASYENQAMLDAVKKGDILGFATNYPVLSGRIGVDMAVRVLEGKKAITTATSIPQFVTKASLGKINLDLVLAPPSWKPVYSVKAGQ